MTNQNKAHSLTDNFNINLAKAYLERFFQEFNADNKKNLKSYRKSKEKIVFLIKQRSQTKKC
jgi:hypothetical protein